MSRKIHTDTEGNDFGDLDFVTKLIEKLEQEKKDSNVVPVSYLDLDPMDDVSEHDDDDDEPVTEGYESDTEENMDSNEIQELHSIERPIASVDEWRSCDLCVA